MKSLLTLIQQIKRRPAMYTSYNSIQCLRAYLDGWLQGQDDQVEDIDVMNEFQDWIERFYKQPNTHSWDRIIQFYSTDDAQALTHFFELFDRFLAERSAAAKKLEP